MRDRPESPQGTEEMAREPDPAPAGACPIPHLAFRNHTYRKKSFLSGCTCRIEVSIPHLAFRCRTPCGGSHYIIVAAQKSQSLIWPFAVAHRPSRLLELEARRKVSIPHLAFRNHTIHHSRQDSKSESLNPSSGLSQSHLISQFSGFQDAVFVSIPHLAFRNHTFPHGNLAVVFDWEKSQSLIWPFAITLNLGLAPGDQEGGIDVSIPHLAFRNHTRINFTSGTVLHCRKSQSLIWPFASTLPTAMSSKLVKESLNPSSGLSQSHVLWS